MRHTLTHSAPFEPGDQPGQHPGPGTARGEGLIAAMREYGLIEPHGAKALCMFSVRHGISDDGYIWQFKWDDDPPAWAAGMFPHTFE